MIDNKQLIIPPNQSDLSDQKNTSNAFSLGYFYESMLTLKSNLFMNKYFEVLPIGMVRLSPSMGGKPS